MGWEAGLDLPKERMTFREILAKLLRIIFLTEVGQMGDKIHIMGAERLGFSA